MKKSGLLFLTMLLMLLGCTSNSEDPSKKSVIGVSLDKTTLTITAGAFEILKATITPDNATNKNVKWSSDDINVLTVDSAGKITAISSGSALITATTEEGGRTAVCSVKVNAATVSVSSVNLNKTDLTIEVGNTEKLVATVIPNDAANQTVIWNSSDTNVALVTDGKVIVVSEGIAIITASVDGKTAKCNLKSSWNNNLKVKIPVINSTNIKIEATSGYDSYNFIITNPLGKTFVVPKSFSTFTFVGVIDENDVSIPGVYKVAVEALTGNKVTKSKDITFMFDPDKEFSIGKFEENLLVGKSIALVCNKTDAKWSVDDRTIAAIDENTGIITGLKVGKVTVTAKTSTLSSTLEVDVINDEAVKCTARFDILGSDVKFVNQKRVIFESKKMITLNVDVAGIGKTDEFEWEIRKNEVLKSRIKSTALQVGAAELNFLSGFGNYEIILVLKYKGEIKAISNSKELTVLRSGYIRQLVEKDGKTTEINLKGSRPNIPTEIIPYFASPSQIAAMNPRYVWTVKDTNGKIMQFEEIGDKPGRILFTANDSVTGNNYVEYLFNLEVYDNKGNLIVMSESPKSYLIQDTDYDNIKPILPVKQSVQLMGDVTNFTATDTSNNMTKVEGKNIWTKDVTILTEPMTSKILGTSIHADYGTYGNSAPKPGEFAGLYRFKFTQENRWDGVGQYGAGWWKSETSESDNFGPIYGDGIGELGDILVYIGYKNSAGLWIPKEVSINKIIKGPILVETPGRGGADNGSIKLEKNKTYRFKLDLENWYWSVEALN